MNGINIVSKAVSTKSTMSNLQCILIEASLSEIKLIANDIEIGIETKIEGNILEAGKIAIDMTNNNTVAKTVSSRSEFGQALIKLRNGSKDKTLQDSISNITRSKESGKYLILEVA